MEDLVHGESLPHFVVHADRQIAGARTTSHEDDKRIKKDKKEKEKEKEKKSKKHKHSHSVSKSNNKKKKSKDRKRSRSRSEVHNNSGGHAPDEAARRIRQGSSRFTSAPPPGVDPLAANNASYPDQNPLLVGLISNKPRQLPNAPQAHVSSTSAEVLNEVDATRLLL
jgi:hypothetical protein